MIAANDRREMIDDEMIDDASRSCPKSMRYGPCGGVRRDRSCEVDGHPCPFVDRYTDDPGTPVSVPLVGPLEGSARRPLIIVDVRAPQQWRGDHASLWRDTAAVLQGAVALIGEHVDNPVHTDDTGALDTQRVISLLAGAGVPVIVTVTGRDRSLADARTTMRAYRAAGAVAIHCVTGDHPAALGIGRHARFGTESVVLAATAVAEGLQATVGEAPSSPGFRAQRVAMKQRAGATLCILNHGGSAQDMAAFADTCRSAGADLPLVAPIPMIGDHRSAAALAAFPGVQLPDGFLDAIDNSPQPLASGLVAAAAHASGLAATGRFVGMNLSGSAGAADPADRLESTRRFIATVAHAWSNAVSPQ